MARGWKTFAGPILLILSGNDYTAKEFLETATTAPGWRGLLEQPNIQRIDLPEADHTFSSAAWRNAVAAACRDWIGKASSAPGTPPVS